MKKIPNVPLIALLCAVLSNVPMTAQDVPNLYELLKPTLLKIGILPNLNGQLDGTFGTTIRWNKALTSGAQAIYSGSSEAFGETTDEATLSSKTFSENSLIDLTLIDFMLGIPTGTETGFGLSAALACGYSGLFQSTSGYKTVQADTIFFNQDKTIHKIMPTVDFGLSAVFGGKFTLKADGAFLPYVLMLENGSKLYSTYDSDIPYALTNSCMGWKAGLALATMSLPVGDLAVEGNAVGLFGTYNTRQDVVTGNYITKIETTSDYASLGINVSVEYKMTYLQKVFKIIPAISVGYTYFQESYGDAKTSPMTSMKAGMTLSSK